MRSRPALSSIWPAVVLTLAASVLAAPASSAAMDSADRATLGSPRTVADSVSGRVRTNRVLHLTHPSDQVAAYWQGHRRARVQLAFSVDGEHFAHPVDAGRDDLGRQRHDGTTYGLLRSAGGAVAVRVSSDHPIDKLTLLGLGDAAAPGLPVPRLSSTTAATATATTATTAGIATATTAQPSVVSRSGWGADPALMTWEPQFYATKKLVVHHTDTSNDYVDRAGAEAQIRSIYYYHSVTQGWGDIGYNFVVDKFGTIYEGRYSRDYGGAGPSGDNQAGNGVTGAHTSGWNSGTVGIAMLGTFTNQDVTPAARQAVESLLAWEASRNGIDPQVTQTFVNPVSGATITTPNVAGHRDYAATLCPGDTFYATLPVIRADVAARIAAAQGPSDSTAPTSPSGLTATGGRSRVTLGWAASSDDTGVAGYQIWRSRKSGSGFVQVASTTRTSYVDGSLARRTTFYYKVRAYDVAANTSPYSSVVSAKTS